ncbi:MAG: type II secretion system F family protein [Candidatus Gracilibacteria bacterium]|nr:type II secretion system F family protein [Candidatus Gracilibacteria bacterium]
MEKKDQIKEEEQKQYILFKKVSVVDKANFYEYISVMIDGGVSFTEALESVDAKIDGVFFKEKIMELLMYIQSGDSFSKSMKKMPDIFESSEVSIVEAGEQTGTLVQALAKLSEDLKKIHNLRKKITGALTYPFIIFLFLILAVIIVLVYVIPAITPLFTDSDVELPLATQALVATSDFVKGNLALLFLFFASLYVMYIGYRSTKSGREQLDQIVLHMPLVGKVYKNYILSNISASFASLIGSGVSIMSTLKLVGKSCNNEIYEQLFNMVIHRVSQGEKIVDSMREVDPLKIYFPADFTQMLSVGEKTATLENISRKLNNQYEKEVEYSLASLTKWIEPLAILLAGLFVSWFAFAIFGAIMKVTQTVG